VVALSDARRVISAAEKKAAEIGQPMNIAVADEGGNLVAHVRMDGAWIGSIDISIKKAYTSEARWEGGWSDWSQWRIRGPGPGSGRGRGGGVLSGKAFSPSGGQMLE